MIREKSIVGFAKTGPKVGLMWNSDKRLHLLAAHTPHYGGYTSTDLNEHYLLVTDGYKGVMRTVSTFNSGIIRPVNSGEQPLLLLVLRIRLRFATRMLTFVARAVSLFSF
jgi:hypothetical protein